MKKKLSVVLSIMLAFAFVLAGCGTSSSGGSAKSSGNNGSSDNGGKGGGKYDLVKPGYFTFAASGEFKPFSYMKGGKMVGYDIAVGKAIAKKLGLKPNPQKAKFSGIVTGVKQHRYDAAVASHTITPERLKEVDFSQPYYYSGPQIFTRPDSDIQKAEDLKGKEVSVSRGSTYVKMAQKYTNNIPQVDSDVVALQSLAKGHHDAVITDAITGQIAINNGLKIKGQEVLGTSKQAVAVAKGNDKLKKDINKALDELKKSGELKKLSEKWVHKDITKPLDK
jgi:polar amino acid transport system substrate-binding protein